MEISKKKKTKNVGEDSFREILMLISKKFKLIFGRKFNNVLGILGKYN